MANEFLNAALQTALTSEETVIKGNGLLQEELPNIGNTYVEIANAIEALHLRAATVRDGEAAQKGLGCLDAMGSNAAEAYAILVPMLVGSNNEHGQALPQKMEGTKSAVAALRANYNNFLDPDGSGALGVAIGHLKAAATALSAAGTEGIAMLSNESNSVAGQADEVIAHIRNYPA